MISKLYKKLQLPLFFWGTFLLFIFVVILQIEGFDFALKLTLLYFLPNLIPVHLHEIVFEEYFLKKRFLIYGFLTLIIIGFFGYLFDLIEKHTDPKGDNSTIASMIIIIFIYMGVKYLVAGTKQQFRMKELESKQAQAELDLLKSQVNPHFLFNSLNSIYSLTLKSSPKSSEAVMLLSDLMRYILETSKKKFVPIKEEIKFIENYIELEKLRLGSNFTLNYKTTGVDSNLFIAPMILITFVENVFKHGVSANQSNNTFDICIDIAKTELHFTCSNNIVLKNNELEQKENQTGIANVKRRLELLYSEQHNLTIEKNNGKFQVNLTVKLNS
jgi:hypothetical protein